MNNIAVVAKSWNDILYFYMDLIHDGLDQTPMLEVVNHIVDSNLSERLFAYTSHSKLVLSIYNPIEPFRETLHLEFIPIKEVFSFIYYSKQYVNPKFTREYPEEFGISKLNGFIESVQW